MFELFGKWMPILMVGGGGDPKPKKDLPDTEEDDFEIPDNEEDLDLTGLFDPDDEDEDIDLDEEDNPDEADEAEEEDEEEEEEAPPEDEASGKTFTQDELEEILKERLARKDRQFQEQYKTLDEKLNRLEQLTGMNLEEIETNIRHAQVRARADEKGITEDEARNWLENEQKATVMEKKLNLMERQNETTQRQVQYDRDKSQFISDPRIKPFEKEIDQFSQNGLALPFEPAMMYVLGKAVYEKRVDIEKDVEQKTLSKIKKKSKGPEGGGSSGGGADDSVLGGLSREEKILAHKLGVSPKEFLDSKKKLEHQKKQGKK